MKIENLRSPYVKTGGIFYFARMLDKIRLHAAGKLTKDFVENLGKGFDGACLHFLKIDYAALTARTLEGGSDDEMLAWAFEIGCKPDEREIFIWNEFMRKRGLSDDASERLVFRLKEGGWEDRSDIQTMFDYIDLDEGRDPKAR